MESALGLYWMTEPSPVRAFTLFMTWGRQTVPRLAMAQ